MWFILLIFIILGLVFVRFEHHSKKIKIVVIILICFLLYFSIKGLFSNNEADLSSPKGIVNAVYVYVGWLGHTASNFWDIGKDTVKTVGNAIKINNSSENRDK